MPDHATAWAVEKLGALWKNLKSAQVAGVSGMKSDLDGAFGGGAAAFADDLLDS